MATLLPSLSLSSSSDPIELWVKDWDRLCCCHENTDYNRNEATQILPTLLQRSCHHSKRRAGDTDSSPFSTFPRPEATQSNKKFRKAPLEDRGMTEELQQNMDWGISLSLPMGVGLAASPAAVLVVRDGKYRPPIHYS